MNPNGMLLEIKHLSKVFTIGSIFSRRHFMAVNDANLTIGSAHSEIFTLAGESGSGKTTLARMILGMIDPTEGMLLYKGKDVTSITRQEKRRWFMREVQPIFQNPFETFNPLKKVDSYLHGTAWHYGTTTNGENVDQLIEKALHAVGLSPKEIRGRYPNELSGGQLQRTAIARALITNPSLLIADEPVSMVDASLRMSIVNLFKTLNEQLGVSVIYVTHDLATAYYVSHRIAIMLRGVIVEMGPVENVLGSPLHPYTQLLKQSVPEPDPQKTWEEDITLATFEVEEYARRGCKFAGRCPHVMDVCKQEAPEDIVVDGSAVKCYLYGKQ
jgi:peptide/nickel transport system ATP-binding protein